MALVVDEMSGLLRGGFREGSSPGLLLLRLTMQNTYRLLHFLLYFLLQRDFRRHFFGIFFLHLVSLFLQFLFMDGFSL